MRSFLRLFTPNKLIRGCAKNPGTKYLESDGDFRNRCPVKMTQIFQLHPLAKIVRYSAMSTCVHARVPGIPEVGRYTDRASPILNVFTIVNYRYIVVPKIIGFPCKNKMNGIVPLLFCGP